MFETIKRLMRKPVPSSEADQRVLTAWAKESGYTIKTVSGHAPGLVVHTTSDWRVEWGPSQRPYFPGHELRFRCESSLSSDVQALWLSKTLAQTLESDVFQRFTDVNQTRIDNTLPDEMRWLAMHPKVSLALYPLLGKRFLLISNAPQVAERWLSGDVAAALEEAAASWWIDPACIVLTINRGILTVRMSGDGIEPNQLVHVGRLFDVAAARLRALSSD
jgi:hypothetical protein